MAFSDNEESNKPEFYHEDEDDDRRPSDAVQSQSTAQELDDDEIGELNVDELGSKVWLVKVPTFLAEKWKQPRKDGAQIGKMRITHIPEKNASEISIILNNMEEYKEIPKEYRMQMTNEKVRNMFIFSESRDPNEIIKPTSSLANKAVPIALTGTVHHECTMTPEYSEEYKRIMHKRVMDQHENSRKLKTCNLDDYNRSRQGANISGFDTAQKKQKVDTKMARMERKDLMDMLFAAFAKFPYWPFKSLVEHTRQPSAYLKEVLVEVAILNKRGPYAAMYSLKPEFRKDSAAAAAAAASAENAAGAHGAGSGDGDTEVSRSGDKNADLDNQEEDDDFEDV
ncbi:hypothetical protein GGI07_002889 [Coemansia sp. Benny D115]|nr:hypothetical protein GGI07_002889 [Coemansia sp. Benny D115]